MMEANVERTEVHRLFHVERDQSANDEVYKITGDLRNIPGIIMALRQLDLAKTEVFCVFGDNVALEDFLHSLFPNAHLNIKPLFSKLDTMPTVWAIHNDKNFVFLLISANDAFSEKSKSGYFTVVMQRFLQDMCRNIIICPSETFFLNFSTEHSFHGTPHETRTYHQVKTQRTNINPPQRVKFDDKSTMELPLEDQCRNVLITNNSPNSYCVQKVFHELNQSTMNSKYNKLKELLQTQINFNPLSQREILTLCETNGIHLSKTQKTQIENNVKSHVKHFESEKTFVEKQANSQIKELLGLENKSGNFHPTFIEIGKNTMKKLVDMTTDWLINLKWEDENVNEFVSRLIVEIYRDRSQKNRNARIGDQQIESFTSELLHMDKRGKIRQLQQNFIDYICIAVQSENQVEVYFNIHQLHYHPLNDAKHRLQCVTVTYHAPIQFSLDDVSRFMNILDLSESDRREFSRRIECVACFKTYDGISEIIIMKKPHIISKKISPSNGHSVLLYKNGILTKLADFMPSEIYFAYSSKPNSQTLVFYNYATGKVTRCPLNEFGQLCANEPLDLDDRSKKPIGVKSLALTVSQDLLILIDSNSTIYSINIDNENTAVISLLYKTTNYKDQQPNFTADNGELYQAVQTIGERSPVFFFQAKSCIDIMDQNYCQIYSIELNEKSQFYKMQIFTDFIDTYCVLFNAQANEVYCVQNLISDTRIERQESSTDLEKSAKQYIGNQVLDTIKRGEIQFGAPDSSDETEYHFILPPEHSTYNDRVRKYFKDLGLSAKLKITNEKPNLLDSSMNIEQLCKILISRVPLQLCTIDMGTLVPLNNGRRDRMDHLSSESFGIDMKAREISFSCLDSLLNEIGEHENLRIVGVVGRQSTGKSYLLNKIFQTRFAVAAGRCTDGIWMSYTFIENTHFIILDCEGLFSDQRTEDEEIKLIAFLAAMCDITILSQDLGFSRFQDKLFAILSQGVDKITKNDKLFKGILLVAVRDISDNNAKESFEAAEQKFLDLQRRGQSGFLDHLFSNVFKIQLLHHFENINFDHEIKKLRKLCINHAMTDPITRTILPCRWDKGKDLADRLKILLVQLYTDDFVDSNEVHANMKLSELDEELKRAWTTFDLNEKQKEQQIQQEFEGKSYSLTFDHTNLQLDDVTSDNNFENICDFITDQLHLIINSSTQTKEERNRRFVFINQLIPEVMNYRRQHVRQLILTSFQKRFPSENEVIRERRTKYMNSIEQYMLSFKLQVCLKKCTECDLKCVKNAQHTEEAKAALEKKKNELTRLQASSKTEILKNIEERIQEVNEQLITAMKEENELSTRKAKLSDELKYLIEKEKLEADFNDCSSKMNTEKEKIEKHKVTIHEIEKQLIQLIKNEEDLQDKERLLLNFNNEMEQLLNADQYNKNHLKKLIEEFHQSYEIQQQPENELICFNLDEEQTNFMESTTDFQFENLPLSKMMNNNISNIDSYYEFVQQCSKRIEEEVNTTEQRSADTENRINETERQIKDIENQKEETTILLKKQKEEHANAVTQLAEIDHEMQILSKKVDEENKLNDTTTSSDIEKIQFFIKELQSKLDNCQSSCTNNQSMEQRKNQEDRKLQYFLEEKTKKEYVLAAWKKEIESSSDDIRIKELQEQITKNELVMMKLQESIGNVHKAIKSIEEEVLMNHDPENAKHELTEELNQANQLLVTFRSYEEKIVSAENKLSKANKSKTMRENNIVQIKNDQLDGLEEEERQLTLLNETIGTTKIELDDIKQEKSLILVNNTLIHKILNDSQNWMKQQKTKTQNRLDQLSESSKRFNEDTKQIETSISVNENRLKDQDQGIVDLKKTLDDQKVEQENYLKLIQSNKKQNEVGTKLLHLLTELKGSLTTMLKRLKEICEARNLIQNHMLSSIALKSATDELASLSTCQEQLTQQLHVTKTSCPTCHYTSAQECKDEYDKITNEHASAHLCKENLDQVLTDLGLYSRLKRDIKVLEREAQSNCNCETDHKCSGICQICAAEDKTKQKPCMFSAGHNGEHKCDTGHVCDKFCQICQIYGFPKNRCHFSYGHKEPEHHQCERAHQCPATCVCSDPCGIPLDLNQHDIHRCNKTGCWKPCMFSCGNLCAVQDHNHDVHAEMVTLAVDHGSFSTKKHLCNQSHYCKGICDALGVCKQEYKTQQRTWTTESGQEFNYEYIEVEEVRGKCGIKILEGNFSHNDIKNHRCDGQHTCHERCPDCGSFCKNVHGHDGHHRTLHRNKDFHVFTSTNPTVQIEICSNELEDTTVRKYKVGESAQPENCSMSCKRRGRSHFHLVECPGGSNCWEKKLVNKAKHSNETYYYGPDNPSAKKYDQILCSAYWSQNKWFSPVNNDADRKLIDSCNTYCSHHMERDTNGLIVKDSLKGFCTLGAWHIGDHVFECQSAHHALAMYQGVDVCFVLDTTGSMSPYFEKVKTTITRIIQDNQALLTKIKSKCNFQFAVVDYRDHAPEGDYVYHTRDFTDHATATAYVISLKSGSGGDLPEAVLDGLDAACDLKWRDNTDHLLFHILDAPPHGKIYHTSQSDKWPDGCPCGKTAQNVLQKMKKKKISYRVLHCSNLLNMMITDFKNYIDVKVLAFNDKITFDEIIAKQVYQQLVDTEMTLKRT